MANNKKENKIEKFTKEAIGKTLNQFNKEIGIADLVEINKNQDRILNGILSQVNDENTEKTEKSNIITLDNSTDGIVELQEIQGDTNVNVSKIVEETPITHVIEDKEGNVISLDNITEGAINIDNIQGNTMVNCNKEADKELVLMEDLSTEGYSNVTLTEGVDGGKVDIALEGNTMVNVCDQKDPVAITKSYTVETGNHVALQGEYDGKCRPVVTGNTLVNLVSNLNKKNFFFSNGGSYENNIVTSPNGWCCLKLLSTLKTSTKYTIIFNYISDTSTNKSIMITEAHSSGAFSDVPNQIKITSLGKYIYSYTTRDSFDDVVFTLRTLNEGDGEASFSIMILEGDYTNKPIPSYFQGLQSSFEDNLVTQEMVDNGEELAENLGKYKVDYVVTGKNKFDKSRGLIGEYTCYVPCQPNTSYITNDGSTIWFYDENKKSLGYTINSNPSPSNARYLRKRLGDTAEQASSKIDTLQIEEGTKATSYEPYKEYKKTFYLNSPLLEGDTIEDIDGSIYHIHRYTKVVLNGVDNSGMSMYPNREFNSDNTILKVAYTRRDIKTADGAVYDNSLCDKLYWKADITGSANDTPCYGRSTADWKLLINIPLTINSDEAINTYLQSNPLTFVLPLETPTYELIEQSNLAIPSYVNGHLDFNTVVPVSKVNFLHFEEELTYLYPTTSYTIQFVSDKEVTVDINLGGTSLLSQSIIQGLNRISITTPDTLVNNKLIIDGLGANISEVVVTDTDREFKYFEGMTSVGENGLKIYSGKPQRFGKGGRL